MRKIVLSMHVSLDGFVGGPNGEMNWIKVDDEIFEIAFDRTNESDTALYGRVTYEMMQDYWPTAADKPDASKHDLEHSAWYNNVTKVVLSTTINNEGLENTIVLKDNILEQVKHLKQQTGRDILIFGSPSVVHLLMTENLIDEFWLMVNPVLLGRGIPLFENIDKTTRLTLQAAKTFKSGVVCLHYTANVS